MTTQLVKRITIDVDSFVPSINSPIAPAWVVKRIKLSREKRGVQKTGGNSLHDQNCN